MHRYALEAFRFLCRFGQLSLAEQLALAGVWDVGGRAAEGRKGDTETNSIKRVDGVEGNERTVHTTTAGERTAWMTARLKPATRQELRNRRTRILRALEEVRRCAGTRGAIFVLPRVGVDTKAAASAEWDLRIVPTQRGVVRGEQRRWLSRRGTHELVGGDGERRTTV